MSYLRMYRDDYVKENELEHLYLNHTEKFVTYMEEQGLGDRIFDIGPDQLRQSVAEYSKRGSIKTINTMNNHLNAIRNFFVYLHKKGKADNIFNRIGKQELFFALFFQSHSYAETVFNTPFYYALKETGYELGKRKNFISC